MPDIINRYLSNVLTVDQIETLRNKTIDGSFNTFLNIPGSALSKITDKTKLHDEIVYKDVPNQTLAQHSDINLQGLQDGDKLEWDTTTSKWVNVQITEGGGQGDVTGGTNIGTSGANVFYQENASHILEFSKIYSSSNALTIGNNGDRVELNLVDSSTIQKGIIMLAASGEQTATKAVSATDSRLNNDRTPLTHKTSHQLNGSDFIRLDDLAAPEDNTDLNASVTNHGLMMKYPNNTTTFLRGDGTFAAPSTPTTGVIVLDREVNELYYSSNSNENTVFSHVVGGGTLGTDGVLRITVGGQYVNNTGSAEYCDVRIKIDSTVLWGDHIQVPDSTGDNPRGWNLQCCITQANSASSQKLTGTLFISDDNVCSYGGYGGQDDDEGCIDISLRGYSSINWASDHTVSVTVQLSSSSSSHTFTRDLAIMEQL